MTGDTLWIMPDRQHPLDKGYRIWSEAMRPLLGRFCDLHAVTGR